MVRLRFGNESATTSATVALRKEKRKQVTDIPRPGRPVRGSETGRPIMALLDLLGRRWALMIIWELRDGALSFRQRQARGGAISSSVLNQRLAELREAGIVDAGGDGYTLTDEGRR